MLSGLIRDCLETLFPDRLAVHWLEPSGQARPSVRGALLGHLDGLDEPAIAAVLDRLRRDEIGQLFIDGSNLGSLARAVKRARPATEITTFCHNVEARFFLGALRNRPSVHALGVLVANALAERRAVRWSNRLLALSERDSRLFRRLYGRAATDVVPMALADKLTGPPRPGAAPGDYALFVGGSFYANLDGISWYVDEVVPKISLRTVVVGHGMDAMRERLERHGKVEVVGPVDSLEPWYLGARVVVAPIFDGSGMKTKTAEALMFGKRVIGTREAFSGYEAVADTAGWLCDTAAAFAAALGEVERSPPPAFDPRLRAMYERHYSREAAADRLAAILQPSPE